MDSGRQQALREKHGVDELAAEVEALVGDKAIFLFAFSKVDEGVADELDEAEEEGAGDEPDAAGMDDAVGTEGDEPLGRATRVAADFLAGEVVSLKREIGQRVNDDKGGK